MTEKFLATYLIWAAISSSANVSDSEVQERSCTPALLTRSVLASFIASQEHLNSKGSLLPIAPSQSSFEIEQVDLNRWSFLHIVATDRLVVVDRVYRSAELSACCPPGNWKESVVKFWASRHENSIATTIPKDSPQSGLGFAFQTEMPDGLTLEQVRGRLKVPCKWTLLRAAIQKWAPMPQSKAKSEISGVVLAKVLEVLRTTNGSLEGLLKITIGDFNVNDPLIAVLAESRDNKAKYRQDFFGLSVRLQPVPTVIDWIPLGSPNAPINVDFVRKHPYVIFPLGGSH